MTVEMTLAPVACAESAAPSADIYVLPASFAQQRLWFLDRLEPGSAVYNIPLSLRLRGALDLSALQAALNEIVRRHEILRTTFALENDEPVQIVHPFAPLTLVVTNLEGEPPETVRARLSAELGRGFDLSAGPLLRLGLLRLDDREHVLVMTVHHIVFDGWSREVWFAELAALYEAYVRGKPSPLPEPTIQYADYAVWQREWLRGEALERELEFWRQQLAGAPPLLELVSDHPRPAVQSYRGARMSFTIAAETVAALERQSRSADASLFMTLLAAFQVWVYRTTGQNDIVLGAPIANRNRHEIERLIGFFVNTLVLRNRVDGAETFRAHLERVRKTALDAYAHQDVPFEKLVETLQPARTLSYAPLAQVAINYLQPGESAPRFGDLRAEWAPGENHTAKLDLTLNLTRTSDELGGSLLRGSVEYSTDLYEPETIARLVAQWQTLLESIAADPTVPIDKLPLLTACERTQILHDWNDISAEYPQLTLTEWFEQQVARAPGATALVFGPERLSYCEVNARANQLARYLRARGVGAESPVGVMLERSPNLVITLLAILKAGGAYVPLDPAYPPARLEHMLNDARPVLVVTVTKHLALLDDANSKSVCIDRDAVDIARESAENPGLPISPDDLAYILYTSGSTGEPRGVMGLHRGAVNRIAWMQRVYPFLPGDVGCFKTSLNFVDSVAEFLAPLSHGIPLVIVPDGTVRDPNLLVSLLAQERVSRLTLVPSLLRVLVNSSVDFAALENLRLWVCSGEAIDAELARAFYKKMPHATLLNLYGSSEASADSTWFEIPRDWQGQNIPIGRPLANTQVYILNDALEPCPARVAGEIYVGGVGLARGYWNQPALTAECFVPNPFRAGETLLKTGDRGRCLPDGVIEYLGRRDRQIKLRGMRVEPGEIETALRTHPLVRDAAVVAADDVGTGTRLVAYVVSDESGDGLAQALRAHLAARLPAHMMPASFVMTDSLPHTPSGKVDTRALRETQAGVGARSAAPIAPRDAAETRLQAIWQRVLKREQVGIADDFFELGGHSLLAIVLFNEIENEFKKRLPVATLFQAPTIAQLAPLLRQEVKPHVWSPLVPIQGKGSKPLFFCIHGFGGGVIGYGPLAQLLGHDQPFFGLQARGQKPGMAPDTSIEAMAERYVTAIRARLPNGPYYLGGYCYGGTVAFEVAQQLTAQGETVAFLGMFENSAPKSGYRRFRPGVGAASGFLKNLPYWGYDFVTVGWRQNWLRLERELRQRAYYRKLRATPETREIAEVDLRDILQDVTPISRQHQDLIQIHVAAMIRYQPKPYAGRVTVFRTRRQPLFCSYDPSLGWRSFAAAVDVRLVDGSHHNLLQEPYVRSLARALEECLAQARTNAGK